MKKKAYFIFNPYAGKGLIKNHLLDVIDTIVKAGYELTVYPTQSRGDAIRAARACKHKYDLIICSGGDGTLDEVVTGMMQSEIMTPIGYIPAGSTNDFANSLNLPSNMKKAADIIAKGEMFLCDIGDFNKDAFVYIAAFGIFTEVSYVTSQEIKNSIGHMAYVLEAMKQLQNIKSHKVRVSYENQVIEDEFIFGMITNSLSVGGIKKITGKNVDLADGLFEVTLIKAPKNPLELNSILTALVIQDIGTECMYSFKTNKITFESMEEEPIAWTLDGEYGGEHMKAVVENRREIMKIIVPGNEYGKLEQSEEKDATDEQAERK